MSAWQAGVGRVLNGAECSRKPGCLFFFISSVNWLNIWVTVSLDDWTMTHLWILPLLMTLSPRFQPHSNQIRLSVFKKISLCAQPSLLFPSGEYGSIWYLNGSNCVDLFMLWVFNASQADRQVPGLSTAARTSFSSTPAYTYICIIHLQHAEFFS